MTFQDMGNLKEARPKDGFAKIDGVCRLARERRITRAWVDTCCIDKSSSAELTESINSMFQWYKEASVCVAFLQDLNSTSDVKNLIQCMWFTRGWTLQEMIAPVSVEFYDCDWRFRGTKSTLSELVLEASGVDAEVLGNPEAIYSIPVARRMSWAAKRLTTRVEDHAYSLLGIFDVNMPLIYGEGEKAFLRLQEIIAREMDDLSLLAWSAQGPEEQFRGAFAKSPLEFEHCRTLRNMDNPVIPIPSFTVTNKGFQIHTSVVVEAGGEYLLNLHCSETRGQYIAICLMKTSRGFVRASSHVHYIRNDLELPYLPPRLIIIPKQLRPTDSYKVKTRLAHSFHFRIIESRPLKTSISLVCPEHLWDVSRVRFLSDGHELFTAFVELRTDLGPHSYINYRVICGLIQVQRSEEEPERGFILTGDTQVEPWAFLLNSQYDSKDIFETMEDAKGDPFALNNLGNVFRTNIHFGEHDKLPPNKRTFLENGPGRKTTPQLENCEPVLEARVSVETNITSDGPEYTVVIKLRLKNQPVP